MKLFVIAADPETGEWIEILNESEISREDYLAMQDDDSCHWDQADNVADPKTGEQVHGPDAAENAALKLVWVK